MIIIPATVKPDQTKPHQIFDFSRRRVNHSYNRLSLAFDFPVYKKQVREDLFAANANTAFRISVTSYFKSLEYASSSIL